MRASLALAMSVIPAAGQAPLVRLLNASRPAERTFQIGDRFEILITGAPNQPISVRTTMNGRTDWGPVMGSTDSTGRWSATGQFDKSDFGSWQEVWTVGTRLANPAVEFQVNAPCLPGGQGMAQQFGIHTFLTCETSQGSQSFSTPSDPDPFRTPDGRLVPGRSTNQTRDEYQMGILQELISGHLPPERRRKGGGDETAGLIANLIGVNALNEVEIRNVLAILRGSFEKPEPIAPGARYPTRTLDLLRQLTDFTDQPNPRREIVETIEYVQSR